MGKREKENPSPVEGTGVKGGAFAEIRTPDQLIKSQLLYQLSYEGIKFGDGAKDKPSFPDCKPVTQKKGNSTDNLPRANAEDTETPCAFD